MAIAKGTTSKEAQEFKKYIGITPVTIKAINPSKQKYEELFNTTLEESPVYFGTMEDNDGNTVQNARVQIIFQPDNEKIGFEMPYITMNIFLQNRPRVGANSGKTQVVDEYGRFAWVSPEELTTHSIPMYKNGPANISKNYRPAYVGEEDLMEFIKEFLCIPSIDIWDSFQKKMVLNTKIKPEECECRFDNFDKVFKGDFSEILEALAFQPLNKIKILLGVRTDKNNGRLYQTVYTRRFLRNASIAYSVFDKEIKSNIENAAANGRILDTEYEAVPVHEYSVTPTVFTPTEAPAPTEEMPFGEPETGCPWD